jgi:cation:H+ antiporter
VGSNIANVLIVVGLPAMIHPIISDDPAIRRETVFMILVSVLFVGLCFSGPFGLIEGLLLLSILLVGTMFTVSGRGEGHDADEEDTEAQLRRVLGLPSGLPTIGLFVLLGCVFLPLGADLTVEGAVGFAARFGVSDAVIGSTLVAFGTSLPELSTTVIAAFHKSSEIALGNVLGSNVLNILAIIGIAAMVADIPVPPPFLRFDLWVMLGAAVFVALHVFTGRAIGRGSGAILLAAYFGYFAAVL